MIIEPNNLISEASNSGIGISREQSNVLSGSIDSISDIDLYRFELERGQGITLDIDTVKTGNTTVNFDSYLRVFDAAGNELSFNDDFAAESEDFSLDSYISFIANATGEYYVGVSSIANNSYNPINGENINSVQEDLAIADYDLTLNVVEVIADGDRDNQIAEAIATEPVNPIVEGEIDTEADVDIYKFTLEAGKGINLNLQANNSDLDSFLRVFDSQGRELAFEDNGSSDLAGELAPDSTIKFAPDNPGEYFVGVSSAGNFNYDALNGNTNLNLIASQGISTGSYQLELDIVDVVADEDPDNTIAEAIDSGVTSTGSKSNAVSGAIDSELDADLYRVTLGEAEGIYLDINGLDSGLDSFLRLFDRAGNELTFDDNDDFNFTGEFNKDSALTYAPTSPGEYYVGVSAAGNFDYDSVRGRNNFSPTTSNPFSTTGNYNLQIDLVPIVADIDPDNTIDSAIDSGANSVGKQVFTGEIDEASEADIYQFQLAAGKGVSLNLKTTEDSNLDSYLRLFDSTGKELAFNDDNPGSNKITDSSINFIAEDSGLYFVGVSSGGNFAYDAVNGSTNFTNTGGFSTGSYELEIDIANVVVDNDPDNTLAEANITNVSSSGQKSQTISEEITSFVDSDIYEFELSQGEIVTLDLDAASLSSSLDSVLRLFDAQGNELTTNDDNSAPEESSSTDSFIDFTAPRNGKYYVGVSSFGNFDYDPVKGSNNFSDNVGSTIGDYELVIDVTGTTRTTVGTEQADMINGTAQVDIINGLGGNDTISGAASGDSLTGGGDDDSLRGNDGDDLLLGSKGQDDLFGGAGNDTLNGNGDSDRLYGNAGADIFVLEVEGGMDTIFDFTDGTDKIMLNGDITFADLVLANSSQGTKIAIANKEIGLLLDVDSSLITVADFL